MLKSLSIDTLENLKILLSLLLLSISIVSAILIFKLDHSESSPEKRVKNKASFLRWIYLMLLLPAPLSIFSIIVDSEIDTKNKQEQKSTMNQLTEGIQNNLKLGESIKNTAERQGKLLDSTQISLFHSFYPFQLDATIKIYPTLDSSAKDEFENLIAYFSKNRESIKLPKGLEIYTDYNRITISGGYIAQIPLDIDYLDSTSYDKNVIRLLRRYLLHTLPQTLPTVDFKIYDSQTSNKKVYECTAAPFEVNRTNNLAIPYCNFWKDSIEFDYSVSNPITFGKNTITSLYHCQNGFVEIKLGEGSKQKLETVQMHCGINHESFFSKFSDQIDLRLSSGKTSKTYTKNISSFLTN